MSAEQTKEPGATTGLRMKDLTRETGLTRETIHFYIAQGLVPPGTKTGRNTAEYGSVHLYRLQRIRDLQSKHFLPLRAIKALLEHEVASENLTPQQEALLARVRETLPELVRGEQPPLPLREAVGDRIDADELEALREAGIVDVIGRGRQARIRTEDAEILRAWIVARDAGLGPERGIRAVDLAIYDSALKKLVRDEVKIFSRAFADRPASEATAVLEATLPLVDRLLTVIHRKHIRRALSGNGLAAGSGDEPS